MKALSLLVVLTQAASAQCRLAAPTPIDDPALRQQAVEHVPWGYLSPVLKSDDGPYTLVDLLHPTRRAEVGNSVKLGVVTPSRGLAVEAYQQGKLYAGPLKGGKLAVVHEAGDLRPLLDAVDGANGDTWVVLQEDGALKIYRIDGAGKIGSGVLIARGPVLQARLARLGDGRLAVAFADYKGGRRYGVSSLWLAWLDTHGQPLGDKLRLDGVKGMQQVLDVALATSGNGVVAAWNPITQVVKGKVDHVPVELRAFHVEPGSAPRLTRRDLLSGVVWHIPEAGGILPNQLQAASAAGQAVLIWEQLVSEQSMPLMAAPAEGGAVSVIAAELIGAPLLRSDGGRLVVGFWDRNQYKHAQGVLACKPVAPGPAPAPLNPPPALPTFKKPGRAELDALWKHVEALAKKTVKSDVRAKVEAQLGTDEARIDCIYDCLMAAATVDELDECGWL